MATINSLPLDHMNYTIRSGIAPQTSEVTQTGHSRTWENQPSSPTKASALPLSLQKNAHPEPSQMTATYHGVDLKSNTDDCIQARVDRSDYSISQEKQENQIWRPEIDKTLDSSKSRVLVSAGIIRVVGSKQSAHSTTASHVKTGAEPTQTDKQVLLISSRRRADMEANQHHVASDVTAERRIGGGLPKQTQAARTLFWLTENYERADGVCLPRCVLYTHYLDFCKKNSFSPSGAASFGKIIRQKFPKLTTRRLGTRGQSKYHYYGIGIKETSIYYHSVYTGKGLTRFSGTKVKTEGSNRKHSLSSKAGTLLPDFPDAKRLMLPDHIDDEKVQIFIMMYRTHCQRILDTVISANFEEIQSFLLHFWQGMPEHLVTLLHCDAIGDVIALCDSILYKAIADVLIPSTIQELPDSLSSEIKAFIHHFPDWMANSLEEISPPILARKQKVLKTFQRTIKRQLSFIQLAQTSRGVLLNADTASQMAEDLSSLDLTRMCHFAGFRGSTEVIKTMDMIKEYFGELRSMIEKQVTLECLTEWLDTLVDTCVLQTGSHEPTKLRKRAGEFLLLWTAVGSWIKRDLTLATAKSFGSLHLLHITMDEYVFLVMDTQDAMVAEQTLRGAVRKHIKDTDDLCLDLPVIQHTNPQVTSPRNRKRKQDDVISNHDSNDSRGSSDSTSKEKQTRTAFETYPETNVPSSQEQYTSCLQNQPLAQMTTSAESSPSQILHKPLPLPPSISPPLKAYSSSMACTSSLAYSERTPQAFMPHFPALNSYPEYSTMPPSTGLPSPRVTACLPDHPNMQSYPTTSLPHGNPFHMASATNTSPYLNDVRNPGYADPYASFHSYNRLAPCYDSYGRQGGVFRHTNSYPDGLQRSAFDHARGFDPPRSFYPPRPQDSYPGPGLGVNSYGSNFMDMSNVAPQYGRQDLTYFPTPQDDFYSTNMASSFTKQLLSPFR